jgi:hypothetical protein
MPIIGNRYLYKYILEHDMKGYDVRKNDPMKRMYWFFFICEGFVALGLLLQTIASIAVGRPNYFSIGYLIFFVLLLIFVFFTFKRRHRRTEERRQRALSGDPAFLVQPQPIPDAQAVSLPAKIELHISIKYMLELYGALCILLTIVGTVVFIITLQATTGGQDFSSKFIPIFAGIIFGLLCFTFLLSCLVMLIMRPLFEQEVVLDEQGITTKFYRKITQIPWNEVQSFAMWGNAKRFSTIQFEVTSDPDVARWFQLGSPRKVLTWMTMLKPNMPYDEYRRKMAAIQQVIVARTGKSLYDLRDEKIVWW